jgi:hypothetical protein
VEPFTQKNHDDLFVRISTVPESLLLVFRKNRQLFHELLASIGINDIVVRKKCGGEEGLEMVVRDEMVMVAKVKLLKSRLPIKEKRKALEFKSAGTQHRHPRGSCCKKTVLLLLLLLLLVVVVVCCCWWWCCQGQQGQQQQQQRNRGSVLASP